MFIAGESLTMMTAVSEDDRITLEEINRHTDDITSVQLT